ncbi:MAG: glycine cleavage system protein GcvH [Verrucomicrobiae bacterium]|nr:glycine cleavage system protein GcvH [Verrucomicrobiae bacterium]MDW8344638.1 glycine cleavage system protein GcvH [Verrucomicrobiae bacterium]
MNIPANLKYTKSHEWVRVEGDVAVVGITDHAQQELTDIVHVEPPKLDTDISAGQPCAVVESVKAASDIYSPVSGEIVAINEQLTSQPELLNRDPYGQGWIFKVKLRDPAEVEELLSASDYAAHIGA